MRCRCVTNWRHSVIWFYQYDIQFNCLREEAIAKLQATLASDKWSRLVSSFADGRVKIYHKLPLLFSNSWNPIFVGRFVQSSSGTKLVGHFRVHWFVFLFILAFFGMLVFQLQDAWSQPEVVPGQVAGWRDRSIAFQLEFLGLFLLINLAGWALGIPYQRRMLAALREGANDA
jgi:hypothetical protein